jgi:hypothetical protein
MSRFGLSTGWRVLGCGALLVIGVCSSDANAEAFHKLTGRQIALKVAGREFTDEVHWREVYDRDGTLRNYEMGSSRSGKWRVAADQLCVDVQGSGAEDCYQLWTAGDKVELRREADLRDPIAGVLRKPTDPVKQTTKN